ncbi:cytoplasmic polyadenylation element-binding protein 1-like [Sinocyclocheilus grahami]|uniref:cytoplasmic polyadenylation element-binding protein 1-like n=1 Tax=Sinocyclocheilus grahami TaxID=75366 RepID=UPI0007AD1C6C|nr:PREDICTED: cytoplasmic polyadenylation element-binding protein 1-like [Sinocyclocheilus grahami]
MAFSLSENPRLLNCLDSDIPALSTCSNADAFSRMNTMLGNSLDLSGVCTTPSTKCKRDPFYDRPDSDLSAVRSRMLFPSGGQDSSRGLPDVNNWGLGLQSLSLSDWERPWSSHDTDPSAQTNTASLQGILGTPSRLSNKLPSYSEPSIGAIDFLEKFPGMARLNSQSFLESHSISPVDSETSGFSSGSDHLSDLLGPEIKSLHSQWGNLELHDDVIYRRWQAPREGIERLQLLVPHALRPEVLHWVHGAAGAGHFGNSKTVRRLRQRFYWPGCR